MDSKISALNSATVLTDADVLPIVNGAETKKVTVALLKSQVTVPTQTSQLTNNGANGVNPFITALDIPTAGQAGTLVREVKNMTGATLTKGTVVYISGANGNKPLVSKALATTDLLSSRTFGLLQSDILNNGLGYCVVIGDLTGFNTSSFTDGDQLYLSGVTAGAVTNVKPTAPIHLVYVGKVTRSHPTLGQIEVGIQNGYELEEIHDVSLVTPTNNQALIYESSTDLWKNKTVDKTFIGLANVDNTSDANKPISTATQTALNLKQNTITNSDSITQGSTNLFLTSAERTKLTNTTNVNSGDETTATILTKLGYSINQPKIVVKDATLGSTITGTTAETLTGTYLIPANTFSSNDVMRIPSFVAEKVGAVGTLTLRIKVGTTATFGSSTLIATYVTGITSLSGIMIRNAITIRNSLLRLIQGNAGFSRSTDLGDASVAVVTVAFNPAVDNYIFTSLQLSASSDSVFQSNFLVTN